MPRDIRWQKTQPPAAGPIGITQNPGTLTCLANQAGGASLATLTAIGGTGISVVFSVTGNANLTVVGNTLKTVASPSFTAGVNQTYTLHVTDTGGSFADPTPRTLTVPAGPSGIISTPSTINSNATLGTLAANLTDTGGTSPFTWAIAVAPDNFSGFLNIASPGATSTLTLNSSGVGNLVGGTPLTGKVIVTDAGGNSFTSSTISVAVNTAATAPTGVNTSPSSLTIRSDQAGAATLATLTEVGGSGSGVTFSVIGNANLTVSGSNLNTVASPSFTAGVNQTYFLSVTDSAGTYTDSVARTLTVLAVPTNINTNPGSVNALANATANTVLAALTEVGGTGASVVFSVSGNTNLKVVGSNLEVNSTPSFTAGVNQTFTLGVTDSGGSFTDPTPRTLTVPAGPSAVALSGNSVLDNATAGTLVSTISVTGGTAPYTFAYVGGTNANFNISPTSGASSSLVVSNTGPGSIGTQSVTISATDAAGVAVNSSPTTITVQDHTASSFVANFTLPNTSGSTQVSPFTTDIHALQFAKGAIVSGTWPICKIGTTVLSYSCAGKPSKWSDGSLKILPVAFVIPTGNDVAGNGSLTIATYTGGTQPAASSRTTAEFPSDMQVEFDVVAGDTGTFIANIADGVTNGKAFVYMDGGAGKAWKIIADAKKAGVAQGQLQTWFYIFAKNNSSGGLANFQVCPRPIQPNVDKPGKQLLMFSRVQFKSGGNLILDPWASAPSKSAVTFSLATSAAQSKFSVPSAGAQGVGLLAGTNNSGFGCMVSNSGGALPSALSANTPYFYKYSGTANQIYLFNDSGAPMTGGSGGGIGLTDAGSGTQTLTPYPFLCWGASFRVLPTSGRWNFVQGSGSVASDITCTRLLPDKNYLHSTRILPPYDLTVGTTTTASITYVINGCGNPIIDQSMSSTGERPEIGPLTNWAGLYCINQDAGSESNILVGGLCEGHNSTALYNSTTGTQINGINATAYTGLPQPPVAYGDGGAFRWYVSGRSTLNTITDTPTANFQSSFLENDTAHKPLYSYAPFVIFGRPDLYDTVMEQAMSAFFNRIKTVSASTADQIQGSGGATSSHIVSGTTYTSTLIGTAENLRADSWCIRDCACAIAAAADGGSYDGADHKSLFTDALNNTFTMHDSWRGLYASNSYPRLNGVDGWQNTGRDSHWQRGYTQMAGCLAYGAAEITAAKTMLEEMALFPARIWTIAHNAGSANSFFNLTGYHCLIRQSTVTYPSPLIDTDVRLGSSLGLSISFTSGNANLSFSMNTQVGPQAVPNVNDQVIFYSGGTPLPPSGFSLDTTYYVKSVSGSTLQLSLTQGGAAVTPAGSVSGTPTMGVSYSNQPGSAVTAVSADNYACIQAGWMNWYTALGLAVNSGMVAEANAQLGYMTAHYPGYKPNVTPKYTFASAF